MKPYKGTVLGDTGLTIPQRAGVARDKLSRTEVSNIRIPANLQSGNAYFEACKTETAKDEGYKVARYAGYGES